MCTIPTGFGAETGHGTEHMPAVCSALISLSTSHALLTGQHDEARKRGKARDIQGKLPRVMSALRRVTQAAL